MEINKDTTLGEVRGALENLEGYVRGTMNKAKDALDKIHGLRMATYLPAGPVTDKNGVDLGFTAPFWTAPNGRKIPIFTTRRMFRLPEPEAEQPKPAPCRGWGQYEALTKAEAQPCYGCASYEPDVPEPSVEQRLRAAGATSVAVKHDVGICFSALAFVDGERVKLLIEPVSLPRAEAALRASQGLKYQDAIDELAAAQEEVRVVTDKFLAERNLYRVDMEMKDKEIERLKGITEGPSVGLINELRNTIVAQRNRLALICETVARPDGGTKHAADNAIRHADEWLARTAAAELDRERTEC